VQNNPLKYIDPSGHKEVEDDTSSEPPKFGTTAYGNAAHAIIQEYFLSIYKTLGRVEDPVSVPSNSSGRGYADMVIKFPDGGVEVFEAKPISYFASGDLNASAKNQLNGYVKGYLLDGASYSNPGTIWDPNGVVLRNPFNPNKELVLETHYDTDPGLIYYYERYKPGKQPVPVAAEKSNNSSGSQKNNSTVPQASPVPESPAASDKIAASTGKAATAAAIGTAIYWIISEGSRLFPPRNLIPIP
jgi:hypothetical protein